MSVGGGCGSRVADGGGGGGNGGNGGSGGNGGNSGNNGGDHGVIGPEVASLSAGERLQLKRKCPAVLQNPTAYSADAVRVCRVVAQIAGR